MPDQTVTATVLVLAATVEDADRVVDEIAALGLDEITAARRVVTAYDAIVDVTAPTERRLAATVRRIQRCETVNLTLTLAHVPEEPAP